MQRMKTLSTFVAAGALLLSASACNAISPEPETATTDNKQLIHNLRSNPVEEPLVQKVPGFQWVSVEPGTTEHNICSLHYGGTLTEINSVNTRTLVRYTLPTGEGGGGARCNGGEVFFIQTKKFASMTADYKAAKQAFAQNKAVVESLLANPVPNPRTAFVSDWQWVDIEPRTAEHDTCGIQAGGTLTEIGVADNRVLVRYTSSTEATPGTPCDGGEVFFVDAEAFESM